MAITQLDCFHATTRFQVHEGVLAHADFTPDLAARLRNHLGISAEQAIQPVLGLYWPASVTPQHSDDVSTDRFTKYYKDITIPEGAHFTQWGTLRVPAGYYHFEKIISPLRNSTSIDEIKDFPFPKFGEYDERQLLDSVKRYHNDGRVVEGTVGHLFENAWQIRGMEQFLMDMLTEPESCDYILDQLFDYQKARACALAHAGVDYIRTGDDVSTQKGMMFSVEQWRYFLKHRWKEIYQAVKAINPDVRIWYHSDGDITDIIPELIDIGVDILNPIQPECMNPITIGEKWGDQLVLDGCLGTQTVMPFGSPDTVRDTIRSLVDRIGKKGSLILAPTHILEPEVPIANIEAFAETIKEYGNIV